LDTESDRFVEAYSFQIEHVCHDLNLLRAALGQVTAIDYADVFNDARYLTANLRYDDLRCSLESGVSARNWFEEYLRVDTPESRLRLEFDNPFKRHAPPSFEHTEGETTFERTTRQDSHRDSFQLELDHFVRCLRDEATPRTSLDEAAADVSLLVDIFEAAIDADQAAST
jgi:predicted dehydrogenase